jgi:hypothetical protein
MTAQQILKKPPMEIGISVEDRIILVEERIYLL